jgi:hypothetical protein
MKINARTALSLAVAASCSFAYAGSLTADFTIPLGTRGVEFTWTYNGTEVRDEVTALIQADRTDNIGDAGVDSLAPSSFAAFCVEIGETIRVPKNHTYDDVVPLLGATTNGGGATGPVLFDATRTMNMEYLWGSFYSEVANKKDAAAFQMAVWEIAFDDDLRLSDPSGDVYVTAAQYGDDYAVLEKAQGWLSQIKFGYDDFGNPVDLQSQEMVLLTDGDLQDLVAPVPEPASMLALAAGIGFIAARRRNRK